MAKILAVVMTLAVALVLVAVVSALMAFPCMWLWNYSMPVVFGAKEIDWAHMWALMLLSGFLVKASTTRVRSK